MRFLPPRSICHRFPVPAKRSIARFTTVYAIVSETSSFSKYHVDAYATEVDATREMKE